MLRNWRKVLLLSAATACSQDSPDIAKDPQASSISFLRDSAAVTPIVVNNRWLTQYVSFPPDTWAVVLEVDSAVWCDGEIQWCHTLRLSGWLGLPDMHRAPQWKVTVSAAPGGLEPENYPRFYRAIHLGCCDVSDAWEFFSLTTGLSLFRSTRPLVVVTVPNSHISRVIGFLDTWSALEPAEADSLKGVAGVLQYGPSDGPIVRILLVDSLPGRHCCRVIGLRLEGLRQADSTHYDLWIQPSEAPELIGEFTIRLTLLPDYDAGLLTVGIPIRGDRPDITHARLQPGLHLVLR